jgi:hypothetical protein
MNDWLFMILCPVHGDVTITGEGQQNLGLCSVLRAIEQGGIFVVPHLLWHGTLVFSVLSEGPFSRLLRHTRGCGGSILNRIFTGWFTVLRLAQEFFTYMESRRHHCRWRGAKFRPMLKTQGLWAGRDLYRATRSPTVTQTQDFGFSGLIRRTVPFSRLLRHPYGPWGCGEFENLF